jgi:dihydrofolate reductase
MLHFSFRQWQKAFGFGSRLPRTIHQTTNMSLFTVHNIQKLGKRMGLTSDKRRWLSVKEISWCSSNESPTRRQQNNTNNSLDPSLNSDPIDRFGIVAAMSKNRVIGVDGAIPWKSPEDRKIFKRLTKDSVLIIGRRTFEEQSDQKHIDHTRQCIVVSKTIDIGDLNDGSARLQVARSLDEALTLAKTVVDAMKTPDGSDELKCWIAGGERIYEEALRHPSA